jgi:HD-like signal output (HDOD) protein
VGMACPLDSRTIEELQTMTGMRVRPLLVSMHDVRVALKRYYGEPEKKTVPTANYRLSAKEEASLRPVHTPSAMPEELLQQVESSLTFESLAHLVRDIKGLPALPETVTEVRAAMDNPQSSAKDVAEILERDPSLSAKALSLANSTAVGASQRVNTVQMAVSLLGLREVYAMALAAAVVNYFERSKTFDYKAFWKRSMFCAKASRIIAQKSGQIEPSVAFGAGLMHDLGRVVLAEIAPARYGDVDQKMKDAEIIAKEHNLFGISHPEVGFILSETWKLPEEVAQPIRWHAELAAADLHKQVVAAVALSSLMADAYGKITKDNVAALAKECRAAMDILNMNDQQFIQVLGETAQAMKEV